MGVYEEGMTKCAICSEKVYADPWDIPNSGKYVCPDCLNGEGVKLARDRCTWHRFNKERMNWQMYINHMKTCEVCKCALKGKEAKKPVPIPKTVVEATEVI
jgi:hypothetical protein